MMIFKSSCVMMFLGISSQSAVFCDGRMQPFRFHGAGYTAGSGNFMAIQQPGRPTVPVVGRPGNIQFARSQHPITATNGPLHPLGKYDQQPVRFHGAGRSAGSGNFMAIQPPGRPTGPLAVQPGNIQFARSQHHITGTNVPLQRPGGYDTQIYGMTVTATEATQVTCVQQQGPQLNQQQMVSCQQYDQHLRNFEKAFRDGKQGRLTPLNFQIFYENVRVARWEFLKSIHNRADAREWWKPMEDRFNFIIASFRSVPAIQVFDVPFKILDEGGVDQNAISYKDRCNPSALIANPFGPADRLLVYCKTEQKTSDFLVKSKEVDAFGKLEIYRQDGDAKEIFTVQLEEDLSGFVSVAENLPQIDLVKGMMIYVQGQKPTSLAKMMKMMRKWSKRKQVNIIHRFNFRSNAKIDCFQESFKQAFINHLSLRLRSQSPGTNQQANPAYMFRYDQETKCNRAHHSYVSYASRIGSDKVKLELQESYFADGSGIVERWLDDSSSSGFGTHTTGYPFVTAIVVLQTSPKSGDDMKNKKDILLLTERFKGNMYNLVFYNCNHYVEAKASLAVGVDERSRVEKYFGSGLERWRIVQYVGVPVYNTLPDLLGKGLIQRKFGLPDYL